MNNIETAKQYLMKGWNDRNFEFLETIIDPKYHPEWMLMEEDGPALTIREIKYITNAVPDWKYEIVDYAENGNNVWMWYKVTGTHLGIFFGFQPTHKTFNSDGATIFFFNEKGRIIDRMGFYCFETIFNELGLSPPYWDLHKYLDSYQQGKN